jgi:hypothetical protein
MDMGKQAPEPDLTPPPHPGPYLASRESVTTAQLTNLLGICGQMMSAMVVSAKLDETGEGGVIVKEPANSYLRGEARIAAEQLFVKACNCIEDMLADKGRWSLEQQRHLETKFNEEHAAHIGYIENQRKVAEEVASPHFCYRPKLAQMPSGTWVAFLGEKLTDKTSLFGVGACPQEAMLAFDACFNGVLPEDVAAWLQQRAQDVNEGKSTTIPFPNEQTQNTNEQNPVDETGNPSTDQGNRTGQDRPGSGGPLGPQ